MAAANNVITATNFKRLAATGYAPLDMVPDERLFECKLGTHSVCTAWQQSASHSARRVAVPIRPSKEAEVPLPIKSSASETGFWGTQWKCPENQVATGARLKVATWTPGADNTMVNGVELTCSTHRCSARWKVGERVSETPFCRT